jgi:hypothetical protein
MPLLCGTGARVPHDLRKHYELSFFNSVNLHLSSEFPAKSQMADVTFVDLVKKGGANNASVNPPICTSNTG